jgi:hypothetical protein
MSPRRSQGVVQFLHYVIGGKNINTHVTKGNHTMLERLMMMIPFGRKDLQRCHSMKVSLGMKRRDLFELMD